MTIKKIAKVAFLSLAFLPMLTLAQPAPTPGAIAPAKVVGNPLEQLLGILRTVTSWFLGALVILAGIFVVYAGYKYLTAAGSEEDVKTANKIIIYAVVAVAIGLLAKVLVALAGLLTGVQLPQ